MLHEPAQDSGPDPASTYKAALGLKLFIVYSVVFFAFVGINVFANSWMSQPIIAGLNLAVIYGFGLIIFALVLALIYNALCTKKEKELAASTPAQAVSP